MGNGPWSWPLKLLTPKQVDIHVLTYKVQSGYDLAKILNNPNLITNYLEEKLIIYVYLPTEKEQQEYYFIDDFKSITEFFQVIEEYFGRYVLFDVEKGNVFIESSEGPYVVTL
ncbi:MAG: hypothetical protein ACOYJ1_01550 [Peptococcales bacterium]